jgi:hypothetical protein
MYGKLKQGDERFIQRKPQNTTERNEKRHK